MPTGTGLYDGLALPAYGEGQMTQQTAANDIFTITGASSQTGDFFVLENSAGTEVFYVEVDGVTNITVADPSTDNCLALTVTDSSTATSGYLQGYYVSLTTSGSYTGSSQVNAIAIDMFLGGTIGNETAGIYIYMDNSGSVTVSSGNIWGLIINMEDLGAAPTHYGGIKVYRNVTNQGSTVDSFMYFYDSGTGVTDSLFIHQGSNQPEYFLKTLSAAPSSGMDTAVVITSGDSTRALRVSMNSTIYFIPLHAATS
jgi:hypothetical protein